MNALWAHHVGTSVFIGEDKKWRRRFLWEPNCPLAWALSGHENAASEKILGPFFCSRKKLATGHIKLMNVLFMVENRC